MTPQKFIATIGQPARVSMQMSKIPASFTVSEGALESGWGAHAPGYNLFGIKADSSWHGPVTVQRTREFLNGSWTFVDAKFRAYTSWLGSIEDHAKFLLTNPRYKPAFANPSGINFAKAIEACGYATDPEYATKIIGIIDMYNLGSLDT